MESNRYVFDTNTLISAALFPSSKPAEALNIAINKVFLFASEATIKELEEVLNRKKFDKYISIERRIDFLNAFRNFVLILPIVSQVQDCRDPKDDKFLDIALAASAHFIISGDKDLLVLHPYDKIKILSPVQFIET
jgi:uncharacterized protein